MRVPFFVPDLSAIDELEAAASRVLRSGRYILGPEVEAFEQEAAAFLGVRYAAAVSSGTDALVCAILAITNSGSDLRPNARFSIRCPAFTFQATAEAIARCGFLVEFGDIDPRSFLLEPTPEYTRGQLCIPVSLFGLPVDPTLYGDDDRVVVDAAQAFTPIKHPSYLHCFSFFPTKQLGGFGDAGLVACDNERWIHRIKSIRNHGAISADKQVFARLGGNYRMDELQAALLRVQLKRVKDAIDVRTLNAWVYLDGDLVDIPSVQLPKRNTEHTWNQFVIRVPPHIRDRLRSHLLSRGIDTAVYYPRGLHRQLVWKEAYWSEPPGLESHPETEQACNEVIALPIRPNLTHQELSTVVDAIVEYFDE